MKKLLLAAALAAVATPALSEAPAARPDADPAIWAVRDRDTTIYLFGTFHLLDGSRDWFNDEVRSAFDRSSELVLEFVPPENPAELQPLMMRYGAGPAGRTLSNRLPPALAQRLATELGEMGVPASAFEGFDPWFAAMALFGAGAQRLGITGEAGAETILTAAARQRDMALAGVETPEAQFAMMDGVAEDLQIRQLELTLDAMNQLDEAVGPMIAAWAAGDIERLFGLMNAALAQSHDLYLTVFVERNRRWADWIAGRMERPGTVFMAVGAGHLGGPDSVQALLAARGLSAQRVEALPPA